MLRKLVAAACFALLGWLPGNALAQSAQVVTSCGGLNMPVTPVFNSGLYMDKTGNLCTNATGASSSFGSAFPAAGTAIGFTDGTNMVAGRVRNPGSGATISDPAIVVVDPNVQAAVVAATIALGQTTKSASVPVTIASDQYIDPCQSPNVAKSSVPINITSTATTSLVAVSGATTVYVCGISLTISEVATTPNTILFEYGTGAACTGPVALTGLYGAGGITAGDPIPVSYGGAGMTIFKSAASNGVCALTAIGGSGSFQGVLTYVQQ